MSTPLTTYYAAAASSTIGTANKLYHSSAGSPATAQPVSTFSTQTQYIEIYSQGGTGLTGAGSIGTPSGHGYFMDDGTLDGQDLIAGSWSAVIRLVAMQLGSQAGSMTADIIVRAFRYRPSTTTYTQIVAMTLATQTINATIANYSLSGTGLATSFASGDRLYTDHWLNVTTGSGNVNQGVRINRQSTDTSTFLGDATAEIVSAGFQPTAGTTRPMSFVAGAGLLPGYIPGMGGSL